MAKIANTHNPATQRSLSLSLLLWDAAYSIHITHWWLSICKKRALNSTIYKRKTAKNISFSGALCGLEVVGFVFECTRGGTRRATAPDTLSASDGGERVTLCAYASLL